MWETTLKSLPYNNIPIIKFIINNFWWNRYCRAIYYLRFIISKIIATAKMGGTIKTQFRYYNSNQYNYSDIRTHLSYFTHGKIGLIGAEP